jgi:hypothetical protein
VVQLHGSIGGGGQRPGAVPPLPHLTPPLLRCASAARLLPWQSALHSAAPRNGAGYITHTHSLGQPALDLGLLPAAHCLGSSLPDTAPAPVTLTALLQFVLMV